MVHPGGPDGIWRRMASPQGRGTYPRELDSPGQWADLKCGGARVSWRQARRVWCQRRQTAASGHVVSSLTNHRIEPLARRDVPSSRGSPSQVSVQPRRRAAQRAGRQGCRAAPRDWRLRPCRAVPRRRSIGQAWLRALLVRCRQRGAARRSRPRSPDQSRLSRRTESRARRPGEQAAMSGGET